MQQWLKTEPLPFFKQLRKERPILVTAKCTLISKFVDVCDVLQMPKIFSVALYKNKTPDIPGRSYLLAHDDDALHYREKSLMQAFLNRDDLPRVRQLIKTAAISALDAADNRIELINDYCRWVPAILVQDYFGLDGIDKRELLK